MSTPPEKLEASIGHACAAGCGNLADVVMVQLATGETDILCQVCLAAMMTAVIAAVAESVPASQLVDQAGAVAAAQEAAAAALAGD